MTPSVTSALNAVFESAWGRVGDAMTDVRTGRTSYVVAQRSDPFTLTLAFYFSTDAKITRAKLRQDDFLAAKVNVNEVRPPPTLNTFVSTLVWC